MIAHLTLSKAHELDRKRSVRGGAVAYPKKRGSVPKLLPLLRLLLLLGWSRLSGLGAGAESPSEDATDTCSDDASSQKSRTPIRSVSVIGSTGPTGIEIVRYALSRGYRVKAMVRDPSRNQLDDELRSHEDLEIIQESADTVDGVRRVITGTDAVISALGKTDLGFFSVRRKNQTLYEQTADNILRAMEAEGIARLQVITSSGTVHDEGTPWFYRSVIRPFFFMELYNDMVRMEDVITSRAEQHGVSEWTIFRPPYLEWDRRSDYEAVRVSDLKCAAGCWKIRRVDLARLMIDDLEEKSWIGKRPCACH